LLSISGIGPRLAVGIIDRGEPESVVQAITRGDLSFFTAVPGVGKKNAARIVLELKSRLTDEIVSGLSGDTQADEVVEALRSLGFSKREIAPVLQKIKPDLPVEDKIKEALKHLSGR
jgi:Holliday junction DNA helicase RuvA